jgi:hypothetical protein
MATQQHATRSWTARNIEMLAKPPAPPRAPMVCSCDLAPEISLKAVGWENFRPSCQCHWPVNSAPFLFCGRAKLKKSAYCRKHFVRSRASP